MAYKAMFLKSDPVKHQIKMLNRVERKLNGYPVTDHSIPTFLILLFYGEETIKKTGFTTDLKRIFQNLEKHNEYEIKMNRMVKKTEFPYKKTVILTRNREKTDWYPMEPCDTCRNLMRLYEECLPEPQFFYYEENIYLELSLNCKEHIIMDGWGACRLSEGDEGFARCEPDNCLKCNLPILF